MVASTRRSVLVKRGVLRERIIPGFFVDGVTENAVREKPLSWLAFHVTLIESGKMKTEPQFSEVPGSGL